MRYTEYIFIIILISAIFFRIFELKKENNSSWGAACSKFFKKYSLFLFIILIIGLIIKYIKE